MTNNKPVDVTLAGCTPEPLMSYLKSLGILRLVSEQKDPNARGWWKNDTFMLRSTLDEAGLIRFFLEEYQPTPIVAPWAGGSGFFPKDNQKAVSAIAESSVERMTLFRKVIEQVQHIVDDEDVGEKPKDDAKVRLIRRYRRELPDQAVAWMDAAMVINQDGQGFAPILGTGGNDGRLDFTQNYMQRLISLGLHFEAPAEEQSIAYIRHSLMAHTTKLDSASVGQFSPGRAGGPNATQGMEGSSVDNPWDFVLMMEGALLMGGAAVRRYGSSNAGKAAFPFTVLPVAAGYHTPASKDASTKDSRGELWLPLWSRKMRLDEVCQLLTEGRVELGGQPVRDGADFARAVASLGVDRGIDTFTRISFLKRSGKAFLAAPLGKFEVVEREDIDLLREVDFWLDRYRRAANDNNAPPRFGTAVERIDTAIFDFCKYGGKPFFQRIVMALGQAERELANAERFREDKRLKPLAGLSVAWLDAANDGSTEFDIARGLAYIYDRENKIGTIRTNIESVSQESNTKWPAWESSSRANVWSSGNLATNLVNVLARRRMDGERKSSQFLPIDAPCTVSLQSIEKFIHGDVDDDKIEQLIWGLTLIDRPYVDFSSSFTPTPAELPRAYPLLKLIYLPKPLVAARKQEGKTDYRFAKTIKGKTENGISIYAEPVVLSHLQSGRLGEACKMAMRRLRASGVDPAPKPIRGQRMRDKDWSELDNMGSAAISPVRLAAALLMPINNFTLNRLAQLVILGVDSQDKEESETNDIAVSAEGVNA